MNSTRPASVSRPSAPCHPDVSGARVMPALLSRAAVSISSARSPMRARTCSTVSAAVAMRSVCLLSYVTSTKGSESTLRG